MLEYHSVAAIKKNRLRRRIAPMPVGIGAQPFEARLLRVGNHEQSNRVAAYQEVDGIGRIGRVAHLSGGFPSEQM